MNNYAEVNKALEEHIKVLKATLKRARDQIIHNDHILNIRRYTKLNTNEFVLDEIKEVLEK